MPSPHAAAPRGARSAFGSWDPYVFGAILLLGLANLAQPFSWDQAMFTLGAQKMQAGSVLYRDYWDPKQPGLFWLYQLGGVWFGFSETGIHAFELLYMLVFCVVMRVIVRDWFEHSWAASLAVLMTGGFYFAACSDWHLMQIEGLVGFPLLLCLWSTDRAARSQRPARWLLLSGVMGGVAASLKLLLLAIPIAFWLFLLPFRGQGGLLSMGLRWAWIVAGVVLPLIPQVLYFAVHRSLELAWWTTFEYPAEVVQRGRGLRLRVLISTLQWFASRWGPMVALAILGTFLVPRRSDDRIRLGLILWWAIGAGLILIQRLSFWPYQLLLFMVPLAMLASRWLEHLVSTLGPSARSLRARVAMCASLLLLFHGALGHFATTAYALARTRLALRVEDRREFQRRMSLGGGYEKLRAEIAILDEPGARPGSIWAMGNPLIYWLSGREQAIPRNGGSFIEFGSRAEWREVTDSLIVARPVYIYVGNNYGTLFDGSTSAAQSFVELLERDYRLARRSQRGNWHLLKEELGNGDRP